MPQMPKRVKFRKSQRGKIRGNACRGNTVAFGEYGLQSLDAGWLTAESIEAGRITAITQPSQSGPTSTPQTNLGVRQGTGDPDQFIAP